MQAPLTAIAGFAEAFAGFAEAEDQYSKVLNKHRWALPGRDFGVASFFLIHMHLTRAVFGTVVKFCCYFRRRIARVRFKPVLLSGNSFCPQALVSRLCLRMSFFVFRFVRFFGSLLWGEALWLHELSFC